MLKYTSNLNNLRLPIRVNLDEWNATIQGENVRGVGIAADFKSEIYQEFIVPFLLFYITEILLLFRIIYNFVMVTDSAVG